MSKKGFTLVELLAVITLLSILMAIAVPNVISTINNNKRNNFLTDASRMIAKAEYLVASSKTARDELKNRPVIYYMDTNGLNEKQEFQTDPDGGSYDSSSYVKVSLDATVNTYKYCICLVGSKRKISKSDASTCSITNNDCLTRDELTGISVVKDK
ncbi:MAG: type II secretion system protein [Bacilli bacterium]|nr:type II secretion system protein [Bacilli bacterium]